MPRAERLAIVGLAAAMAAFTAAFLILGRDLTFWSDELDWLIFGDDLAPETMVTPHNDHLIATTRIAYELFPRIFDAEYLPFRLLTLVGLLACAGLVFVLVRKRVGGPIALGAATVLLFFGTAPDQVLSGVAIPFVLAIAFGLGALVAFDRESRSGDWAGCALLILAASSHIFGAIAAGGIAVHLLVDPARRRRAWAALLPLALWIAWWIWSRKFEQDIADPSNLLGVPVFMIESVGAALASITGAGPNFGGGPDLLEDLSLILFSLAALVGAALLGVRVRRSGAGPWLIGFAAIALAFWAGTALGENEQRQPTTPRYLYLGAAMVMLVVAEGLRTKPVRGRLLAVVAAVLIVGVTLNAYRFVRGADTLTDQAEEVRVQLAMIELAGERAAPTFSPQLAGAPGSEQIGADAGGLVAWSERYDSLGSSLDEVAASSESLRRGADFVLVRSLGLFAAPSATVGGVTAVGCVTHPGEGGAERASFDLPFGTSAVRSKGAGPLLLGRFADSPSVPVATLAAGEDVVIGISDDDEPRGWRASAPSPVRVCEVAVDPAP